jgi:cytochrome c
MARWLAARVLLAFALVVVLTIAALAYVHEREHHQMRMKAELLTGGKVERGERLFIGYGCGGCHRIDGVPRAVGQVGPPLDGLNSRVIIAGRLANSPDNLATWIEDPQAVSPGTAMPRLGVKPGEARDIAAFLYAQ